MTEVSSVDVLLEAKAPQDVLRILRAHLRGVIEQTDPASLAAFDTVYEDGASDAVDEIIHGRAGSDELSGEQALGLRGQIAATAVAFLVNVAAAVAVERCRNDLPDVWLWVAGSPARVVASAHTSDPVDKLIALAQQSPAEKALIAKAIRKDPTLMRILRSAKLP